MSATGRAGPVSIAMSVVLGAHGCSWQADLGTPHRSPSGRLVCDGPGLAVADVLLATGFGVLSGLAYNSAAHACDGPRPEHGPDLCDLDRSIGNVAGFLLLAPTVLYAASGVTGFSSLPRCSKAARDAGPPDTLTRAEVSAGIARIRARADACGTTSSAIGTVTVSVTVSGAGTVSAVSVKHSPDGALGACVAAAVQRAAFAKSVDGATFRYRFKFCI